MPEDREKKFAKDFLDKWSRAEREEGPADEALKEVDEALRERPDDPGLWFRRGSLLTDLERWDEALEAFRRVEALDAAFPRLYVGLSFVLTRLGRAEEAAAAQRKALEVAGGERAAIPEPEREIEETLSSLAEDLAKEAREEEAVKDLEELGALAGEPEVSRPPAAAPETEFLDELARWEAEGYDVAPLREVMENEPDRTRTVFFQFEQNIRKVQVLRDSVDALDPAGLEADIARLRALFRAPYQIWRIEAEMATLMEKADARDRSQRAARVAPRIPEPLRAKVGRATPSPPMGRINGLVGPAGRVNGQTGRVNGRTGQVNGLINGIARGRAGLTNGLTNGLGFTNGLGGPRFAVEARARRGRILLIPAVAVILLSLALVVPPEPGPTPGGIPIDGSFAEWQGVPGYAQPSSTYNADADLREFKAFFQDKRLSLYARVTGTAFGDTQDLDVAYAFVDADGDRSTGYDEGIVGAEYVVELQGGNGSISSAASWTWTGNDSADWSGWSAGGVGVLAASRGSEVEVQINVEDAAFDSARAAVVLVFDDQSGGRSTSEIAFGPVYGALEMTQRTASPTVPGGGLPSVLELTLRAIGSAVTVNGISTAPAGLPGFSGPLTIIAGDTVLVTIQRSTVALPAETMITAEVVAVDADRPVTILGAPARAYVDRRPAGFVVDGVFDDWAAVSLTDDSDGTAVSNPNVNVLQFAAESQNGTAFTYAIMEGQALGGGDEAWPRSRPQQGPPSQPGPPGGPPGPRRGEDVVRVYYDTNATAAGTPIGSIVADALLEIRGRHGRVLQTRAYEWRSPGGWQPQGTGAATAGGSEWEASFELPGIDLRGADFVITTTDWRSTRDITQAGGVRGTRSGAGGVTFIGAYDAFLPLSGDDWIRFGRDDGPWVAWQLPDWWAVDGAGETLLATPRTTEIKVEGYTATYGDAFDGLAADVRYEATSVALKETIVLDVPPPSAASTVLIEFPIQRAEGLMLYATGEDTPLGFRVQGDLRYTDGRGRSLMLATPWAEDSRGVRTDLAYLLRTDRVALEVPASWLAAAAYPISIDPTVTYQLENDNSGSNDPGEQFGYSVAVGDFNGDGNADALVGAPNNNKNGNIHGYAYVFYGPFSAADSSPDVEIDGVTNNARFGYSVAAGKFNNDNYWDLLISRLATASFPGNVEIYFGGSGGPDTTADVTFSYPASPVFFGWWVAAGNLDDANYDDVLIGEPGRDNDGGSATQDGVVHVYMSPFSSTESSSDYTLLPSTNANGRFGRAIAVGEIDSDAYPDVVVGEPLEANGGRVHFFQGSHFTSGSGNVSPDATLSAQASGEQFGAALSVGTLDGDSYADVLVGAPQKNSGAGAAYIFLANSGGGLTTGASPDVTIPNQTSGENFGTSVLVADFDDDGTNGALVGAPVSDTGGTDRGAAYWFDAPTSDQTVDETINGGQDGEFLGQSLAAGRFGSDTRTIALIGAYLWDDGSPSDNSGRVLVAAVPEPGVVLAAVAVFVGLGARSLQRRRLVRER